MPPIQAGVTLERMLLHLRQIDSVLRRERAQRRLVTLSCPGIEQPHLLHLVPQHRSFPILLRLQLILRPMSFQHLVHLLAGTAEGEALESGMLVEGVDGNGEELRFGVGDGRVEDEQVASSIGALLLGEFGSVSERHLGGGGKEEMGEQGSWEEAAQDQLQPIEIEDGKALDE